MNENLLTLYSTIYPALIRAAVLRGTIIAGIGSVVLLVSGTLIGPSILSLWGPLIFLGCIVLVACGLLPYRRLRRLEDIPHKIVVDSEGVMTFFTKGRPLFQISLSAIDHIEYVEEEARYGIAIYLKSSLPESADRANQNLVKIQEKSRLEHDCDLFLPYFSKRSCHDLSEILLTIS